MRVCVRLLCACVGEVECEHVSVSACVCVFGFVCGGVLVCVCACERAKDVNNSFAYRSSSQPTLKPTLLPSKTLKPTLLPSK